MTLPIQLPEFAGRALCAEVDPEAWFPEKGGSPREAKRVCAGCEIQGECLQWALANNEPHGVWGGATPAERFRMRRQRRVTPISHGTPGGYRTHQRRGEKPCEDCRVANIAYARDWAARKAAS